MNKSVFPHPAVLAACSTMADGSMSVAVDNKERISNRSKFLAKYHISLKQSILVSLTYETDNFCRYYSVSYNDAGDGMVTKATITADALFTTTKKLALFLPIADCIAAVVYDPIREVLGLVHLGRHNLEQEGGRKAIEYMTSEYGTQSSDVIVWLSPAAGRISYPLYNFNNRSLHEVALTQMTQAGVVSEKVIVDERDTAHDAELFSHSEFLQGNRQIDGRQAVVAMMR